MRLGFALKVEGDAIFSAVNSLFNAEDAEIRKGRRDSASVRLLNKTNKDEQPDRLLEE